MNKEYILKVLTEQAMEWTGYPVWNIREEYFLNISYHNWAVNEVLKRVKGSLADPRLVISEFMIEMDLMAKKRADTRLQFEAARDAAKWMLDVVESMVEPGCYLKGE